MVQCAGAWLALLAFSVGAVVACGGSVSKEGGTPPDAVTPPVRPTPPVTVPPVTIPPVTAAPSCATNNGGCASGALCSTDTQGQISCVCQHGYTGDGHTCAPDEAHRCETPGQPCAPQVLAPVFATEAIVDGETLYYNGDDGLHASHRDGTSSRLLSSTRFGSFVPSGDFVYGIENGANQQPLAVIRVPKNATDAKPEDVYENANTQAPFQSLTDYAFGGGHMYGINACNTIYDLPLSTPNSVLKQAYSVACPGDFGMNEIVLDASGATAYITSQASGAIKQVRLSDMQVTKVIALPTPSTAEQAGTQTTSGLTRGTDALYWYTLWQGADSTEAGFALYTMPFSTFVPRRIRESSAKGSKYGRIVFAPDGSSAYLGLDGYHVQSLALDDVDSTPQALGDGTLLTIDDAWVYATTSADALSAHLQRFPR